MKTIFALALILLHFFGLCATVDTSPAIYLALLMGTPFTGLWVAYIICPEAFQTE